VSGGLGDGSLGMPMAKSTFSLEESFLRAGAPFGATENRPRHSHQPRLRAKLSGHATGQEAMNRSAKRPLDRPHHRLTGAVRLGDDRIIRNNNPFSIQPNTVAPVLGFPIGSAIAIPSASEQHGPLPLLRLSNHGFRGDPAYRPSSRAIALPTRIAVKNMAGKSEILNKLS
jgi:hypothetical protein